MVRNAHVEDIADGWHLDKLHVEGSTTPAAIVHSEGTSLADLRIREYARNDENTNGQAMEMAKAMEDNGCICCTEKAEDLQDDECTLCYEQVESLQESEGIDFPVRGA